MDQSSGDQFSRACGIDEPLQLIVTSSDDPAGEVNRFRQPYVLIGRRPDADLILDQWQVSRQHAYLQYLHGGFICVDLGSRTGTFGGSSTERAGWVSPDKPIQVGPFEIHPTWPPRHTDREPGNLPTVLWELPPRAIGGSIYRMDRPLVLIGTAASCRIRLMARNVSPFHASLVRTSEGVWVVDLLGIGGVEVNGNAVRFARLEDGDELRIGQNILRPRYEAPPPRIARTTQPARPAVLVEGLDFDVEPDYLPARRNEFSGKLPNISAPIVPAFPLDLDNLPGVTGTPVEPVVSALVHQFTHLQQQMFDQFHQTMLAMFDGFSALHREQSEALRDEMDEVRRLTREIEQVRRETDQLHQVAQERETAAASPPPPPAPAPAPARNPAPAPAPILPPTSLPAVPLAIPAASAVPAGRPAGSGSQDIHAILVNRLARMHTERQGRWQRILNLMSSKS